MEERLISIFNTLYELIWYTSLDVCSTPNLQFFSTQNPLPPRHFSVEWVKNTKQHHHQNNKNSFHSRSFFPASHSPFFLSFPSHLCLIIKESLDTLSFAPSYGCENVSQVMHQWKINSTTTEARFGRYNLVTFPQDFAFGGLGFNVWLEGKISKQTSR